MQLIAYKCWAKRNPSSKDNIVERILSEDYGFTNEKGKHLKNMSIKSKPYRLGELFCGPGGLGIGATSVDNSRIIHQWASDIDESSCKTYSFNICQTPREEISDSVYHTDVKDLKIKNLEDIDIFAYGFPCNDFSLVGKQKGFDGDYGPLYTYGVEVLDYFKPKVFVAENVGGIKSANGGNAFEQILSDLKSSGNGYELTVHHYKSEQYGVPQTRHRYIIVGFRSDLEIRFKVPLPTHPSADSYNTVQQALTDIREDTPNHQYARVSPTVVERLKHIKPGENAWTADLPDDLKLNVKSAKLSQIYKRLEPDKPSYTVTGSGGGGTHVYHHEEPRPLTNRERARLQTFDDNFEFLGSPEKVRRQIGMAVPPLLSRVIFKGILDTLDGVNYSSVDSSYQILPELF